MHQFCFYIAIFCRVGLFDLRQAEWKGMFFFGKWAVHIVADRRAHQCPLVPFLFTCSRCQVMCSTPEITIVMLVTIHRHDDPADHFHYGGLTSETCFNCFIFSDTSGLA